ncbi:MAG TPA: hypothetical protein VGZ47_06395 [Gemmataceae bacterium]|jgi:hypothetical protein|nr:hypothetical protein [Gemmataceae bacterium]
MHCPDEIAAILLAILRWSILTARATDDPRQAFIELDHIHNLPDLLANYNVQKLDYYWNVVDRLTDFGGSVSPKRKRGTTFALAGASG